MLAMIIFLLIYVCCPWYIQFLLMILNIFIPDPIPLLDEVIMVVSTYSKISKSIKALLFFERHPILCKLIILVFLVSAVILITFLGKTLFS